MTDKSVTVKLSKPIKVGTEDRTEITFSEPSLGDLIDAEADLGTGGQHKLTGLMMARMAGLSYQEIRQLTVSDYAEADAKARPLLGKLMGGTGGE